MDVNLIIAIVLALVFLILVDSFDTAIPLLLIGFIVIAFAWNLSSTFSISSSSHAGWGNIIILGYWIIAIFAFMKPIQSGIEILRSSKKHG